MVRNSIFGLVLLASCAAAQAPPSCANSTDPDCPMLGGPGGGGMVGPGAMLRFGCSQVVIERLDPLVQPAANPSSHNHQVAGGNAFAASMPTTDISNLTTCTTCHFAEDSSNYWTANLYFHARNGSYKRVPQIANQFNDGDSGGITVYYTSPGKAETVAFKPGFRMLTGDSTRRTSQNLGTSTQQCYRCFSEPNFGGSMYSPCMDPEYDTDHFPTRPCPGGIRSNIIFPVCWDGTNLDSPNHQDHVAHPLGGPPSFSIVNGTCPSTHPIKIPQVMLEVMWDTTSFNNRDEWPVDESQPFVLSNGDTTGYSQHGDYIFGWRSQSLQLAMDNGCYLRNCSALTALPQGERNACQVKVTAIGDGDAGNGDGWLRELPGGGTGM